MQLATRICVCYEFYMLISPCDVNFIMCQLNCGTFKVPCKKTDRQLILRLYVCNIDAVNFVRRGLAPREIVCLLNETEGNPVRSGVKRTVRTLQKWFFKLHGA